MAPDRYGLDTRGCTVDRELQRGGPKGRLSPCAGQTNNLRTHSFAHSIKVKRIHSQGHSRSRLLVNAQSEPTIGTVDHLYKHCRITSRTSNGPEDMKFAPMPAIKSFDGEDKNICCSKLPEALCAVERSIGVVMRAS